MVGVRPSGRRGETQGEDRKEEEKTKGQTGGLMKRKGGYPMDGCAVAMKKHRGARNEMIACAYMLELGYEVFRNISQHGIVDLVAMKNDEVLLLDVKASHSTRDRAPSRRANDEQRRRGIVWLNVFEDGRCAISKPAPELAQKQCLQCEQSFNPTKEKQRFCCRGCATRNWQSRHGYTPKNPRKPMRTSGS